ncbi:hypothetical protein D3C71_1999140 [compost metagenome]
MLAGLQRHFEIEAVGLVRRQDEDGVDAGVRDQRLGRRERLRAGIAGRAIGRQARRHVVDASNFKQVPVIRKDRQMHELADFAKPDQTNANDTHESNLSASRTRQQFNL